MDMLMTFVLIACGLLVLLLVQTVSYRHHRRHEEQVMRGYFLLGLSGLMAKIAMADGKVTGDEAALADGFFRQMKVSEMERAILIGNFITARRDGLEARDHARRFMAYANGMACEFLYDLLWRISRADGVVDESEDLLLKDIARCLGLGVPVYEYFKQGGRQKYDRATLKRCGVPESLLEIA